jgi:hypothetical protein
MQLLDITKIADFHETQVSKETRSFLQNYCTYRDAEDVHENLISIVNAQDCQMFPSDEVEREVGELARIAAENDCAYVRFLSV